VAKLEKSKSVGSGCWALVLGNTLIENRGKEKKKNPNFFFFYSFTTMSTKRSGKRGNAKRAAPAHSAGEDGHDGEDLTNLEVPATNSDPFHSLRKDPALASPQQRAVSTHRDSVAGRLADLQDQLRHRSV
jgi:hypothetical protein